MIDVHETRDAALLRGLLESDRVGGAYLLGDLDAPFFEKGRWLVATRGGAPAAVVVVFDAFAVPVVLSFGASDGAAAIVRAATLPPRCYLKIPPAHEGALAGVVEIVERDVMKVMALDRCHYRRAATGHDVRRLGPAFPIDRILDVYRSYPGHFFEPDQLEYGIYFGSFEGNRLVAVAGTHVYSPAGRIACVGNIVTAADARGRGHGVACTGAVVEELHARGCDTIALHVAATNAPAEACYRRLGFHEHGPILQLRAVRQSP